MAQHAGHVMPSAAKNHAVWVPRPERARRGIRRLGRHGQPPRHVREQAGRTPKGQWVRVVGGWTADQFAEKRLPKPGGGGAAAARRRVRLPAARHLRRDDQHRPRGVREDRGRRWVAGAPASVLRPRGDDQRPQHRAGQGTGREHLRPEPPVLPGRRLHVPVRPRNGGLGAAGDEAPGIRHDGRRRDRRHLRRLLQPLAVRPVPGFTMRTAVCGSGRPTVSARSSPLSGGEACGERAGVPRGRRRRA
jgi:hypothetical protein